MATVFLSSNSFTSDQLPTLTTDESLTSPYILRAKFNDGTQYGYHAATTYNNNGYALDSIPAAGSYTVALYSVQYDSNYNVISVGTETIVTVTITAATPTYSFSEWRDGDLIKHHRLRPSIVYDGTVSRDIEFAVAPGSFTIWPSEDTTYTTTEYMFFNSIGTSPGCVSWWMRSGETGTDNVPATGKPPEYRLSRDKVYVVLYKWSTNSWQLVLLENLYGGGTSTSYPWYYSISFTSRTASSITYRVIKYYSYDDSVLSDDTKTYTIP